MGQYTELCSYKTEMRELPRQGLSAARMGYGGCCQWKSATGRVPGSGERARLTREKPRRVGVAGKGKSTVIAFGTYPLVARCSLFLAHANLHG